MIKNLISCNRKSYYHCAETATNFTCYGKILNLPSNKAAASFVSDLYKQHKNNIAQFLDGNFIIIVHNEPANCYQIFVDRFNHCQLLFTYDNSVLLISDSIHPIASEKDVCVNYTSTFSPLVDKHKYWYETMYANVNLLKGGTRLEYFPKQQKLSFQNYWNIVEAMNKSNEVYSGITDIYEKCHDILNNYCKGELAPNTALLQSEGLDSTSILSLLNNKQIPKYNLFFTDQLYTKNAMSIFEINQFYQCDSKALTINYNKFELDFNTWFSYVRMIEKSDTNLALYARYLLFSQMKKDGLSEILTGMGSDQTNGGRLSRNLADNDSPIQSFYTNLTNENRQASRLLINSNKTEVEFMNPQIFDLISPRAYEDQWHQYVDRQIHFTLIHELWMEQRFTNSLGMMYNMPFMRNEYIDFICGIPKKFHPVLFTNKNILSKSLANKLPKSFQNYVKFQDTVPDNFIGNKVFNPVYRNALTKNDFEFLSHAYEQLPMLKQFINIDQVKLELLKPKTNYANVEWIFHLINCSILDYCVKYPDNSKNRAMEYVENRTNYKLFTSSEISANPKDLEEYLDKDKLVYSDDIIYKLNPEIELAVSKSNYNLFIIQDGTVLFELDDAEFIEFFNSYIGSHTADEVHRISVMEEIEKYSEYLETLFYAEVLEF